MGHEWVTAARAHVRTPFLYLQNCWMDCVEFLRVVVDPLPLRFAMAIAGHTLHMRTCAPIFISRERLDRFCWNLVCGSGPINAAIFAGYERNAVGVRVAS